MYSLNVGEINSNIEEQKINYFYAKIKLKLGDSISPPKDYIEDQYSYADETKGIEPTMPESDDF